MVEIWKPIPGYEGLYEVSDLGKVKSLPRNTTSGGLLANLLSKRDRRPKVGLTKNGKTKHFWTHTLVLLAFVDPRPKNMECRHLNGNRCDNRLENLQWGTKEENSFDRVIHKSLPYGEKHSSHKLTKQDVLYIRSLEAGTFKQSEVAEKFGINQTLVSRIRLRKCWKHI